MVVIELVSAAIAEVLPYIQLVQTVRALRLMQDLAHGVLVRFGKCTGSSLGFIATYWKEHFRIGGVLALVAVHYLDFVVEVIRATGGFLVIFLTP